jgi:hypothetical protein
MQAHQKNIHDRLTASNPRPRAPDLHGFSVGTISRQDALQIILRYEWLGNIGRTSHFIGLLSPTRELQGVACFGHGPAGYVRALIGSPARCLERGACVHWAPPNAASFLINHACKLMYRITKVSLFFAYADPMAGEYGGVYQAANWAYLGQGRDGRRNRRERWFVLRPGYADIPANWRTTRELRRNERLSFAQARALGWRIEYREAKHLYAIHVGHERDRRRWREAMRIKIGSLPYPAPDPALKRKPPVLPGNPEPVRLMANPIAQPDFFGS